MGKREDLKGKKFGRLTVLDFSHVGEYRQSIWRCVCECGKEITARANSLKRGNTKSCGCYWLENHPQRKHGRSKTNLYNIWNGMLSRCYNEKHIGFSLYGGRGIKVCDKWKTFDGFFEDMGTGYKKGLSIERKNVNGNYEPSNCEWIKKDKQAGNTRRTRWIEVDGEKFSMAEAARIYNINYDTLKRRINNGWEHERAVKEPVKGGGSK